MRDSLSLPNCLQITKTVKTAFNSCHPPSSPSYCCFSRQIPIAPSAPITPHQPLLLTDNFTKFDACLYTRAHVYLSGVPKGYINMHIHSIYTLGAWPGRAVLCAVLCKGLFFFSFFYQLDLCNNTISLSGLALRAVNL